MIAALARTLIDRGAVVDQALDDATTTVHAQLAAQRPELFEKYLRAAVAHNPELDPLVEGMPAVQADVDAHRAYLNRRNQN